VLVIFLSQSGTSQDIVAAAFYVFCAACQKLVVTRDHWTKLASFDYKAYFFRDIPQAFQAMAILLYTYVGSLWLSMANWNDGGLLPSLQKLPVVLISSVNLTQNSFDLTNFCRDEWFLVRFREAVTTVGAFNLCIQKAKQLTKSINIVEAEQFFSSVDRTSISFIKNHLFILVKLEDKDELLMQVSIFLSKKNAHFT
jgi:hypothetical protein